MNSILEIVLTLYETYYDSNLGTWENYEAIKANFPDHFNTKEYELATQYLMDKIEA